MGPAVAKGGVKRTGTGSRPPARQGWHRRIRNAASQQLQEWQKRIAPEGVEVESTLMGEFPSHAIAVTAEEMGADLIVMGTRGLSGIKHVMLGSVAERTVRIAPCPVMTVKA